MKAHIAVYAISLIASNFVLQSCSDNPEKSVGSYEVEARKITKESRKLYDQCVDKNDRQACEGAVVAFKKTARELEGYCTKGDSYSCDVLPLYKEGAKHSQIRMDHCIDQNILGRVDPANKNKIKEILVEACGSKEMQEQVQ